MNDLETLDRISQLALGLVGKHLPYNELTKE